MNMNWFQSLFYGLISGFTEFMPISSRAHQDVLLSIFGCSEHDPIRNFIVHITALFVLISVCKDLFTQLHREKHARGHHTRGLRNTQTTYFARLVRSATLPLTVSMILISYVYKGDLNLLSAAAFLLINGIVLYIPCRMLQGNKDAQSMSVFDSWIIGLSGAFSVISGISRIGSSISVGLIRGADKKNALNWALALSVPALLVLIGVDFFGIIFANSPFRFWNNFLNYLLTLVGAGFGSYLSIRLIRFITNRMNYIGFAYYSWGMSLFSFILYLVIV